MTAPSQGRAGAGGFSPRLGRRDPRTRTNAAGQVGDADLDPGSLQRDGQGRTRVSLFDGLPTIAANATLPEVISALNAMLARGRGR